jgi:hypothetical protein
MVLLSSPGWDLGGQTLEFLSGALGLGLQFGALRSIQFDRDARQSPVGAAGDGDDHLQIAQQAGDAVHRRHELTLPLGFQEQLRLLQ